MAKSRNYPPGASGWKALRSIYAISRDPLAFLVDASLNHGPITHYKLAGQHLFLLNEPELVEQVLVTRQHNCIKDLKSLSEFVQLIGNGLATSEGETWRRLRKLSAPALQPKRVASHVDMIVQLSEQSAASFRDGQRCEWHAESMRLTMAILARTVLGFDLGPEAERLADVMNVAVDYYLGRIYPWQRLIPAAVPTPDQRRLRRAIRELDAIVYAGLARLRKQHDASDVLLAQLMRARDDDGQPLSDVQLRDEAVTMMFAGNETTAASMSFAIYALARHPAIAERVRDELERASPGRALCAADLPQLRYLEAVVRETLRLYPPFYALSRVATEPFELAGYPIEPGDSLVMVPFAMHRNPRFYPDPERFDPERWLDRPEPPRGAYLPFNDGPRVCPGGQFAIAQLKLVLGTLLRELDIALEPGYQLDFQLSVTMRPKGGLPVIVRRREPAAIRGSDARPEH